MPGGRVHDDGQAGGAIRPDGADPRDGGGGKAVWGTCAGMILMAKDIGRDQPLLA